MINIILLVCEKLWIFFYNIPSSKAKKTIYILDGILFFCFDKTALKKKKNKWFFFLYVFPTIFTTIHTLFVYFLCSRNQNKIWSHTQRKICLAFFVNIKMHEVLLLIIQRLKELWIKVYEFKNIVFFFVVVSNYLLCIHFIEFPYLLQNFNVETEIFYIQYHETFHVKFFKNISIWHLKNYRTKVV